MARRLCDVCGVRPATVTVRRIVPGEPPRLQHLCEIHAAEARGRGPSFGGGSPFDDFFSRFFETPGVPPGGGFAEPPRTGGEPVGRSRWT